MAQPYWQSKIWGLLHDSVLKALHNNSGRGNNSFWRQLGVMSNISLEDFLSNLGN